MSSLQSASTSFAGDQLQAARFQLALRIATGATVDSPLPSTPPPPPPLMLCAALTRELQLPAGAHGGAEVVRESVFAAWVLDAAEGVIILLPRAIHAADFEDPQVQSLQSILGNRIDTTLARDVFEAFSNAARGAVDVNINQTTLRSINNNLLGGG